jgi:hypothetical protein
MLTVQGGQLNESGKVSQEPRQKSFASTSCEPNIGPQAGRIPLIRGGGGGQMQNSGICSRGLTETIVLLSLPDDPW